MKNLPVKLYGIGLPPIDKADVFEEFVVEFFNITEDCDSYVRFGRSGQEQHGIDIYSVEKKTIIQCKVKSQEWKNQKEIVKQLIKDLKSDFTKFNKYNDENDRKFNRFIFASTFHNDTSIQSECIKLSNENVTVEYFSWDVFKSKMPELIFKNYFNPYYQLLQWQSNEYEEYIINNKNAFKHNENEPLVDQLYNYFVFVFKEINIIPIHFLSYEYPFNVGTKFNPIFSPFSISTDNDDLFELFCSIRFENGKIEISNNRFIVGVDDYERKTNYIFEKLNQHSITQIRHQISHQTIQLSFPDEKKCNCVKCLYERLEYPKLLESLNSKPSDINEQFQFAYIHYLFGDYVKCAQELLEISKQINKQDEILNTIVQFNLSNLYHFIQIARRTEDENNELLNNFKSINLHALLNDIKDENNSAISHWILTSRFYTSAFEEINLYIKKVRDHYYSQLRGGWSSNFHLTHLINAFVSIEGFINGNNITFGKLSNFEELCDTFFEGLFMSYSMNDDQNNKLETFDDYLLIKMIHYSSADRLSKLIHRYKIKSLKYEMYNNKGETFFDVVDNYLSKFNTLNSVISNTNYESNYNFWNKYNDTLDRILVLLTYIDLEQNQIQKLSIDLLSFIKDRKFLNHQAVQFISQFIYHRGKLIDNEVLIDYLYLINNIGMLHEPYYIKAVVDVLYAKNFNLELPKPFLSKLMQMAFNECSLCDRKHSSEFLTEFYKISDKNSRNVIKNRILTVLSDKFKTTLYYFSVINEIIVSEDVYFNLYVDFAKANKNKLSVKSYYSKTENKRIPIVNDLLNLCFKLGIDTSVEKFKEFRELDPYYDWLFDMKNFDYNNFDPIWINEYRTSFYLIEFAKYPVIKEKVIEYLKNNHDEMLLETIILI